MNDYLRSREACKVFGVHPNTLRSWAEKGKIEIIKTPFNQRLYSRKHIQEIINCSPDSHPKEKIIYCRVFSKKQENDLERQIQFLRSKFPTYYLVTDVASGINFKRDGLKTILELAMSGHLKELVVSHKDRLCRFGFELIEHIIKWNGGRIIVLDDEDTKSKEQELAEDLLSIIQVFNCRQMGKRRYGIKRKDEKDEKEEESEDEEKS